MEQLKNMFKAAMSWLNTKEFTAMTAAGAGVLLWFLGMKVAAGVAVGVFCTRNWDILKDLFKSIKS